MEGKNKSNFKEHSTDNKSWGWVVGGGTQVTGGEALSIVLGST